MLKWLSKSAGDAMYNNSAHAFYSLPDYLYLVSQHFEMESRQSKLMSALKEGQGIEDLPEENRRLYHAIDDKSNELFYQSPRCRLEGRLVGIEDNYYGSLVAIDIGKDLPYIDRIIYFQYGGNLTPLERRSVSSRYKYQLFSDSISAAQFASISIGEHVRFHGLFRSGKGLGSSTSWYVSEARIFRGSA